jgi:dolichyl-phosphate beta-glucosyltransferase
MNDPQSSAPQVSLILPAYNEATAIVATILKTISYFEKRGTTCEIIVAADGDDGTREVVGSLGAKDSRIRVIGHRERAGKGRGIREAVAMARGAIIGYADADYKVPAEEFDKIKPWFAHGYQVVVGTRAVDATLIERKQPLYRRVGSIGFRMFMRAVVGLRDVSDTQCGFKFFERAVARQLFACQKIDGYMFDVEILALAQAFGHRIKEVPVRWRDDGDSRLQLIAGNARNVIDLFRIRREMSSIAVEPVPAHARVGGDCGN